MPVVKTVTVGGAERRRGGKGGAGTRLVGGGRPGGRGSRVWHAYEEGWCKKLMTTISGEVSTIT